MTCSVAPINLRASAGINEVRLSWEPGPLPDADDSFSDPIAFYVQVLGEQERVIRTGDTTALISGLRNGVTYEFRVYSATQAGRSAAAGPVSATPTTGMEGVVAGVIVEFEAGSEQVQGATDVPGEERVSAVDLTVAEQVTDDSVLVEFSEPVDLDTAEHIANELQADPQVAWAEPDEFFFTSATPQETDLAQPVSVPTDDRYMSDQWNLWDQYGVSVGDGNSRMTDAWVGPRGDNVNVAVIDTGITPHPDLDGQLVSGYDFVSNPEQLASSRQPNAPPVAFDADYQDTITYGALGRDDNPTDPGDWREVAPVRDSSWHGTEMAGLIAAAANDTGITGIAPNAKIQPIRALSWRGGLLSDIAASITWASGGTVEGTPTNTTPSKVINMSFAVETICPVALQDAIDAARDRGSILIAAAGNANDNAAKFAPGNCNGVITVGATNRDGNRADYSNYGETIDIAAPGGDATNPITSTSNTGTQTPDQPTTAGDYGTSTAAAHVSAAAALLASRTTDLTPDQAFEQLTGEAFTKAFANPTCDFNPDYSCGTGILTLAQIQTVASGDQDYAMQFTRTGNGDAVGSTYATAPPAGFSSVTGDVSLMAWVNRGALAAGRAMGVVSLGPSGIFANDTTEWAFRVDTTSGWTDYIIPVTSSGEWVHLAMTRRQSDGVITIYLNGQAVSPSRIGTNTAGTGTLDSGDFYVAKYPGWDSLNAQIDEVRVFDDVRTQPEIEADMHNYGPTNTDNLVAYYDFNEGPAGTTGTGTVYNRADGATSATNLRTVNGPTYTDVKQTTSNGNNTVVTFPRSYLTAAGGWRVPEGVSSVDALVVAGGGGGGSTYDSPGAGGGGAGGLTYRAASETAGQLSLTPGAIATVTVGAGGLGGSGTGSTASTYVQSGNDGQPSVLATLST
ncbi:MAG: S8 family serine peptidase, partial [Candidatus Nanopelagicales bacterium]|nr:S8 family serine peptidase [Candidatus Nanopelagicales bacterium]